MKKQFFKTTAIKFYSAALISSLLTLSSFTPANASDKSEKASPAQVTYVGAENNLLTFNVNYDNVAEENFVLELIDDQGQLLYQKKYNDKSFSKKILLRNLGETTKISFIIRVGKDTISQKFDIASQVKTVEEVIVTKL